jgi:hypothetical protein
MSPAQRKSAKARRSATRTARATSTRGKPPGSALAKAMKVKGKTPAKRGSHRKAGRVNGSGAGCDMRREELELLLDREGGRGEVLSHVPGCHPCTTSLTVIASQRDAVRHLVAEPGGTAVEFLLERGAQAGEKKLANLVYELAKACLVIVKNINRRVDLASRPRDGVAIAKDVRDVAYRKRNGQSHSITSRIPLTAPAEADAIGAAGSCISILEELEGRTERQQLAHAIELICGNRPAEAEELLSGLLSTVTPANRLHAIHNLMWAQIRQGGFQRALSTGVSMLVDHPDDWLITYNLVAASVRLGRRADFDRFASRLRALQPSAASHRAFNTRLLEFEIQHMADDLGIDKNDVVKALGLPPRNRASSHA